MVSKRVLAKGLPLTEEALKGLIRKYESADNYGLVLCIVFSENMLALTSSLWESVSSEVINIYGTEDCKTPFFDFIRKENGLSPLMAKYYIIVKLGVLLILESSENRILSSEIYDLDLSPALYSVLGRHLGAKYRILKTTKH